MEKIKNLEEKYLLAKKKYYKGTPIMSDFEFDELEEKLQKLGSSVVFIVGSEDIGEKLHLSPMLSLDKVQVFSPDTLPVEKIQDWNKNNQEFIEVTPKLDGSSCNLIYHKGILKEAITRGNGVRGSDITNKMSMIVPKKLNDHELKYHTIEIRGEVVIREELFKRKYAKDYKNPRNFVAGILGRKEDYSEVEDFEFIAFEIRVHKKESYHYPQNSISCLANLGFVIPEIMFNSSSLEFKNIYEQMYDFRINKSSYQLDGFVLKMPEPKRILIGESSHSPNWALAIKFPPLESYSRILDIEWNVGFTGELVPVAILEPVELDGTTVSRASLHNFGYLDNLGAWPGAKVTIVKSGDIIPFIKSVITKGEKPSQKEIFNCCGPNCIIEQEDIHLYCKNPNCEQKGVSKLAAGIRSLGIKGIGKKIVEKLYQANIISVVDLFDKEKFNKQNLISSKVFKQGRALDLIFEAFERHNELTLDQVINALSFPDIGRRLSKVVAKIYSGEKVNMKGVNRNAVEPFSNSNSPEHNQVSHFLKVLASNGYELKKKKNIEIGEGIKVEMTGSPKPHFKTKNEFLSQKFIKAVIHHGLKSDTDYLITDGLNSQSSKAKKAAKLEVHIITYKEFSEKYGKG